MRIGIDATCWANERGYGRFARQIVKQMVALAPDDEFICYLDDLSAGAFDLSAPNVRKVVVNTKVGAAAAASADGHRSLGDMLAMTRAVWANRPDVFFSPSVYTYFPLPPGLRAVVTIHDAIAERFPQLTVPSPRARFFWNAKVWLALRQARSVLTVSDYASAEISKFHNVPAGAITVVLEAPSSEFVPRAAEESARAAEKHGIPKDSRWFMYVGGFNPHKRVATIVEAHAELSRALGNDTPLLLLVGDDRGDVFLSEVDSIRRAIANVGTTKFVRWLGFVTDDDLSALMSGSIALVLPSESEGFGLPAVEAAACGAPVIATTESPLPSLLSGGGIFVEPGDATGVSRAMSRLLHDTPFRDECAKNALAGARQLTWEKSARSCLAAIKLAAK